MRIHLIAIGGAAMHNIALALHENGHSVSGSDDEIYNPANTRLAEANLLPEKMGWFPEKITKEIDIVILGMHAQKDNPELLAAQKAGLKVMSYPEFIYEHAKDKKRLVIAGSHGKSTSVAMAMHCLKRQKIDFDYLIGAEVSGFKNNVRLSDAPVMILEGDEYFSSAIDPTPKMVHYKPHHVAVTGIAWDHINVFPTFVEYRAQFAKLIDALEPEANFIWNRKDAELASLVKEKAQSNNFYSVPYDPFPYVLQKNTMVIKMWGKPRVPMQAFGEHNLENAKAAFMICRELGVWIEDFMRDLVSFTGASRRLQPVFTGENCMVWNDFAHAPSKVKASVEAVKTLYAERPLVACLELHTFSSLNLDFLPQYKESMNLAETACVFYSPHTLKMKGRPNISENEVKQAFGHTNLKVFTSKDDLEAFLKGQAWKDKNLLMMSSGNFDGLQLDKIVVG
jgi:UDP-N-acetylmuramate: L-alanyl-gamma-D-glutamyl-meso-diaminopimelate ligase